jgi:hypothetical protein
MVSCARCEPNNLEPVLRAELSVPGSSTSTSCIPGQRRVFRGNLHGHTGHSDGQGTPSEAFAYARNAAKLDFLAVTDHLEQLYDWKGAPSDELENCEQAARSASEPGAFLALCGFEYGTGYRFLRSTGHNNVYFNRGLFPRIQTDFRQFYATLAACEECIGQFNHPARESDVQDWNDYEYHEDAARQMSLFEMSGGADTWSELFRVLDAGWHVGPAFGQDNHEKDWGTKNEGRTGVLLQNLTLPELREALSARRTFASWDRNASISLHSEDGCPMGSILKGRATVTLRASAEDPDPTDRIESLSLHGNRGTLVAKRICERAGACVLSATVQVGKGVYVLARATQRDGDILVSAPIWVEP